MFDRLDIPVLQNAQSLRYAFAGGLNTPQFSAADLNRDGIQDLVIFDRAGDVVLTFLNNGTPNETDYEYAPDYACHFPKLLEFVLLRDYDQDGAADIFCSSLQPSSQEMQVFRGYYEGNVLKFAPFVFHYPDCPECDTRYIWYPDEVPGFWNNLPVSKSDYPAVDDVDGDGDLDIICFEASLTTSMFFVKNISVESGYGLDSLKFVLVENCYGKFTENGLEACKACLSPNGVSCCQGFAAPPRAETAAAERNRHPGSTALTYDPDGDGDKDLVLGNISFNCLLGLTNGGTPTQAWMTAQDTAFPSSSTPVDLAVFPASFYLDLDNDGRRDLVVAPNSKTIGEDRKGVWFYKDVAGSFPALFELESKSLFVDEMIDLGTVAHPALADVNADGLLDLVVGNYGYYASGSSINASLYLFLNTGTAVSPEFTLANADWQGLSEFVPNEYDFAPVFGDLDADGDLDMLVGTYGGGLFCYYNQAGAGNPMVLQRDLNPMWTAMDVGISSVPLIYDLDNDNRPDVILGERNGNVNFFKNDGSPTEPLFASLPTIQKLGDLDARLPGELVGHSAPTIIQTLEGPNLILGAQGGQLEAYGGLAAQAEAFNQVSAAWGSVDDGYRSHPALADLDGDGILDLITGNQRGGLSAYRTQLVDCSVATQSPFAAAFPLKLSPNPASNRVSGRLDTDRPVQWRAFNLLGQPVASGLSPNGVFEFSVKNWPAGTYLVEALTEGQRTTARLLVR